MEPTLHFEVSDEDVNTLTNAWNNSINDQVDQAISALKQAADSGRAWAIVAVLWFLHRHRRESWNEAVPYAEKALSFGYVHAARLLSDMIGDSQARPKAVQMMIDHPEAALYPPVDPMELADQALRQGDASSAIKILGASLTSVASGPAGWQSWLERIRSFDSQIEDRRQSAQRLSSNIEAETTAISQHLERLKLRVETEAEQLVTLVRETGTLQTQSYFDGQESQAGSEAKNLWRLGIGVFIVAALLAVTPLLFHYVGLGPKLEGASLLSSHIASAAAFAGVAGIFLSRSRVRDRTRQRAKDLSIALGTMFVYSNQIEEGPERQAFLREMGRAILEAHIKYDAGTNDAELTSLLGLVRGNN